MKELILEACVETYEECLEAEKRGASRIELCADLENDGLTPSFDLVEQLLETLKIPIKVMLRPRPGNFVYSEEEFQKMIDDLEKFRKLGITKIVTGILNDSNEIDLYKMRLLNDQASGLKITFHKAIDQTNNPLEEIPKLFEFANVDSVLTSGFSDTAEEGRGNLNAIINLCGTRLKVIAAGRVTNFNLRDLASTLNTDEFHGRRIVGNFD